MHDLTPFQLISLIALGASVVNLLRVLVMSGSAPATRTSPVPSIRKPPSPLAKPGTPAAPAPKPGAAPVGKQEVLPSSLDSGVAGHQKAAAAKTVKLPIAPSKGTDGKPATEALPSPPPAPPIATSKPRISTGGTSVVEGKPSDADAAALDSLFGNSGKADGPDVATGLPGETKTGAIKRKASRLGELGFHHSIQPEDTESGSKPAITAAPRSSTAELTSILERIDKFLAEDTPPKATEALKPVDAPKAGPVASAVVATAPVDQAQVKTEPIPAPAPVIEAKTNNAAEKAEATKKTQPLWARADAQDEDVKPAAGGDDKSGDEKKPDEGQQRLF